MKAKVRNELLQSLESRFEKNAVRHKKIVWEKVVARIEATPGVLKALGQMDTSGANRM